MEVFATVGTVEKSSWELPGTVAAATKGSREALDAMSSVLVTLERQLAGFAFVILTVHWSMAVKGTVTVAVNTIFV